jgi:molybdopterin-guanine dinucleotide biosynthesis protein A
VIALWPVALRDELRHALTVEQSRKVQSWTARYRVETADWPVDPVDPFFNANRQEDLDAAEALAVRFGL